MNDLSSFNILPFNLDWIFNWLGLQPGEYDKDIVSDRLLQD